MTQRDKRLRNTYKNLELFVPPTKLDRNASPEESSSSFGNDITPNKNGLSSEMPRSRSPLVVSPRGIYLQDVESSVSFNTVPVVPGIDDKEYLQRDFPGVQLPSDYTMEEYYDDESGYASSDNQNYLEHNNYLTPDTLDKLNRFRHHGTRPVGHQKPVGKLVSRDQIAKSFKVSLNGKIVREDYPSKPTLSNDAMIVNRKFNHWHSKWALRRQQIEARLQDDKSGIFKYFEVLRAEQKEKQAFRSHILTISDGYTPLTKQQKTREEILHRKVGFPTIPRTILVYVSGKRHTWVALDWVIFNLATDTDHIVIMANLPKLSKMKKSYRSHSRSRSTSSSRSRSQGRSLSQSRGGVSMKRTNSKGSTLSAGSSQLSSEGMTDDDGVDLYIDRDIMEWSSGYQESDIELVVGNIYDYVSVIMPHNLAVKVTVDITVGTPKQAFFDASNTYTPDALVVGTLRWERTDSLVRYKSTYLLDILATTFPIPTYIVPAKRLYQTELAVQNFVSKPESVNQDTTTNSNNSVKRDAHKPVRHLDSFSSELMKVYSMDSVNGSDEDGLSEKIDYENMNIRDKLRTIVRNSRLKMDVRLQKVESDENMARDQKILRKIDVIILSSINFVQKIEEIKDHGEDMALTHLKRIITGSTRPNGGINAKRPMVEVARGAESHTKHPPSIKFVPQVAPTQKNFPSSPHPSMSSAKHSFSLPATGSNLKPVRSYSEDPSSRNNLRNLRPVKSNDSYGSLQNKKSGKSGGLLSIFKSKSEGTSNGRTHTHHSKKSSPKEPKKRGGLFGFSF